jgi:hypothetical protein
MSAKTATFMKAYRANEITGGPVEISRWIIWLHCFFLNRGPKGETCREIPKRFDSSVAALNAGYFAGTFQVHLIIAE